jgi:hypothetical protein
MFMRTKLIAATAAIALAAIAATPASARWHHHYGWGAPLAGFAAGAIIGGALAGQGPYYYGPGYYGAPAYAYSPGGGSVAYCEQRFKSYDPGSGTYLGYDGYRHSCP